MRSAFVVTLHCCDQFDRPPLTTSGYEGWGASTETAEVGKRWRVGGGGGWGVVLDLGLGRGSTPANAAGVYCSSSSDAMRT